MYAVVTHGGREPFSWGGRVLVHGDRAELEWLIPTHPVVELKGSTPEEVAERLGRPVMLWADHPDMAGIRWPLRRKDFLA
jgi:hypothetical protein